MLTRHSRPLTHAITVLCLVFGLAACKSTIQAMHTGGERPAGDLAYVTLGGTILGGSSAGSGSGGSGVLPIARIVSIDARPTSVGAGKYASLDPGTHTFTFIMTGATELVGKVRYPLPPFPVERMLTAGGVYDWYVARDPSDGAMYYWIASADDPTDDGGFVLRWDTATHSAIRAERPPDASPVPLNPEPYDWRSK